MLKISEAKSADGGVTLKVEGRLVGPWVVELRKVCEEISTQGRTLTLDLADLSYLDDSAVIELIRLNSWGVQLQRHSLLVAAKLKNRPT